MSTSWLYHGFGIRGYRYVKTEYVEGGIVLHITQPRESYRCSACGSSDVSPQGQRARRFHGLPIGRKPVTLVLPIPRVACHDWSGGFTSQHEIVRPVLRYGQMATYERVAGRIEVLRGQRLTFAQIAERLNDEGFRPVRQAETFHKDIVCRLFNKLCQARPAARRISQAAPLQQDEWFAIDLATHLEMPKNTLLEWCRGRVHVTRQLPGYRGRKICWVDAQEIDLLTRLRDTKRSWLDPPLPVELTTPKTPPTA